MPRIPPEELERIKHEVSLVRLIEGQGHELSKRGKDYVMRCVFHEEATPSLVISPAKNLYHCFGCDAGGGVIDWVMATEKVSFTHAVERLRGNGISAPVAESAPSSSLAAVVESAAPIEADPLLLGRIVDYYHGAIKGHAGALAYLAGRGLDHPELIDQFRLGVADRTLGYQLPASRTKAGDAIRGQLQQIGLLRQTGTEHFNGCLTVPVIDLDGQIRQLYGRRLNPDKRQGAGHLYLPQPLTGVWNEAALLVEREIIVCEALIDAMTFWSAGYRNVIAAYGVNGFTADHWRALRQHGTRSVWIAYDRDEAGNTAAEKLSAELLEAGIGAWRVLFPKGMDANEYARKVGPAGKSLGLALQQAQWLGSGSGPGVVAGELANEATLVALGAENIPAEGLSSANIEMISAGTVPEPGLTSRHGKDKSISTGETSPLAAAVETDLPAAAKEKSTGDELTLSFGPRVWRIKGWQKNLSPSLMKVNVQVRQGEAWHVDTFDLYAARARVVYLKQAAGELGAAEDALKRELGQVLLRLEQWQDEAISAALSPVSPAVTVDAALEAEAAGWLKEEGLIARLEADLAALGVVGESDNLLAGYLAATSRKLDSPLAVLIQSSSAAGKSSLMDAVLGLMPPEERMQYSAMTGQSLYYLGETNLQHKILAIAEEEGVRQAAYALKLLQSDGELTIASTGKDETSGELVTKQYTVRGPVMLMLTTTAIDIDEELLNRCLVLTINETREQTAAIHALQRKKQTLDGLLASQDKTLLTSLHQHIQRQLKPYAVVNPFAEQLTFLSDKTRTRRDHMKYLTLIQSIALLHQYQRPIKQISHRGRMLEYLEVEAADIELANRLCHRILGRTLDEMPPQTRRLLRLTYQYVLEQASADGLLPSEVRFTRRDIREATGWSDSQLKLHCARLADMEYLVIHGGGGRGALVSYGLLYDGGGEEDKRLCGLIEVENLQYDIEKSGLAVEKSGEQLKKSAPSLGQVWGVSGSVKVVQTPVTTGVVDQEVEAGEKAPIEKTSPLAAAVSYARASGRE